MNVAPALRAAILESSQITALLGRWKGDPAVHTRRPVPHDTGTPFILISPDVAIGNDDGLTSRRPMPVRDITVFGNQPDQYRDVEQIAYLVRELFHRNRLIISVDGYHVAGIECAGPSPAPVDDENKLARTVTASIRLVAES